MGLGPIAEGPSASAVGASSWRMAMEVEWREEKSTEGAEAAIGARLLTRVMSLSTASLAVEATI